MRDDDESAVRIVVTSNYIEVTVMREFYVVFGDRKIKEEGKGINVRASTPIEPSLGKKRWPRSGCRNKKVTLAFRLGSHCS